MSGVLKTSAGLSLLESVGPAAVNVLQAIDGRQFLAAKSDIVQIRVLLNEARVRSDDAMLDDIFVLHRIADLLEFFGALWEKITAEKFSDSWNSLQDALDQLRLIRRFSTIDLEFIEDHLLALEKAYPYEIFVSIGAAAKWFECSICGRDIDSDECAHLRGRLYAGKYASAIARDLVELDHVALVRNPMDKRCVISFDDKAEQFNVIRFISSLITSDKLRISDFGGLRFSKRLRPNENYRAVGRNEPCFCGSGKKFKNCCISKKIVEGDHVDVVGRPHNLRSKFLSMHVGPSCAGNNERAQRSNI